MKVIGTGTPLVAQVRFQPCEVEAFRAELREYRVALLEADSDALHRYDDPHDDPDLESRQARRLAVEELIRAADALAPDGSLQIEGAFDVVRGLVRSGLREVVGNLHEIADAVTGLLPDPDVVRPSMRALLEAAATAQAWAQTVADLDYVENHGLTDGLGVGKWHVHV